MAMQPESERAAVRDAINASPLLLSLLYDLNLLPEQTVEDDRRWCQTLKVVEHMMDAMAAVAAERARCVKICEEHAAESPSYKAHEDTYLDGWQDASNECGWAIGKAE